MMIRSSHTKTIVDRRLSVAHRHWLLSIVIASMCLSIGTVAWASGAKNFVCLDDCPCSSGVSFLRLTYNGPSGSTVRAEVSGVIFTSVLNNGDVFDLNGSDVDGGFATNTLTLFIDGLEDTTIHLSCSQPIGVGFVFGSFTVEAMDSVGSGFFDTACPDDCPCDGIEVNLTKFGQGGNSCNTSPRPVQTDGASAPFVMTARTKVDRNSPADANASGNAAKVAIDKDGAGVKKTSCSGGKGISGKDANRDEEIAFTYDTSVLAASIQIHLNKIDLQNDNDDRARLLNPVASAGDDQAVSEQAIVTLDGTNSTAQLGPLTYQWTQISGPAVTLSDPTSVQPTFSAPLVASTTPIQFQLTVSDGQNTQADIAQVNVNGVVLGNSIPAAIAGTDIASVELVPVLLDATDTFDVDGDLLTYSWEQVSGTAVVLVDANTAQAKFLSPDLVDDEVLKFRVTVFDGQSASSDTLHVMMSSAPDEPYIYISSTNSAGFDYTITTSELTAAFVSDGTNRGWVDFSLFTSLPSGLMIDAFKLRETNDDLFIDFYLDCTPSCTTDAECSDGDACTGIETCDPVNGCQAGTPLDCDDGNLCNGVETCDAMAGCQAGTPVAAGTPCDDGDACNGSEVCDANGVCLGGTPLTCDDGNECNGLETCDPGSGCQPGSGTNCPPVEVVFVMDTSGSMQNEGNALCATISGIVADLSTQGITVSHSVLAIHPNSSNDLFSCQTALDTVHVLLGDAVPNDPDGCPGDLSGNNSSEKDENWGPATAILADRFSWTPGSTRLIIPISDEGACLGSSGNGCNDPGSDRDSVENAIAVAVANGVIVSPITGNGSSSCVIGLAQRMATGTGGTAFMSSDASLDLAAGIANIILAACDAVDTCDDGDACTVDDSCASGTCQGTPVSCLPDDECRSFVCNPANGLCEAVSINEGLACSDDGNVCTDNVCQAGSCVAVNNDMNTCTDGIACTTDACVSGSCVSTAITCPGDTDCQTFVCNEATGMCKAQSINGGLNCADDGNPCTDNVCLDGACVTVNDDSNSCSDGNACTTDVCLAGACSSSSDGCPADNSCQTFVCNPATGICEAQSINEGLDCEADSNPCTDNVCLSGVCTAVNDDTNACSDSDSCTTDTCESGACVNTPVSCPADTDCQTFVCNSAAGICLPQAKNEGLGCSDDGNACTDNVCKFGVCIAVNDDTNACSDNNLCSTDACVGGACVGTPVSCPDATICQSFACDVADGLCKAQFTNEGLACESDNNPCTDNACQLGVCVATNDDTNACEDGIACTNDSCVAGSCTSAPSDANCSDDSICTTNTCAPADPQADANGCVSLAIPGCCPLEPCEDNNACTDNVCDVATGSCSFPPIALDCSELNSDCTIGVCDPVTGSCAIQVDNEGSVCSDDGNACTDDICRSGVCTPENNDLNICTDNNACTTDACVAGVCVSDAKTCPADTDCETYTCNTATGLCEAQSTNEGLACTDDGNVCTDNVCQSGVCTVVNDDTNICTDNNPCTNDACVGGSCMSTNISCPADTDCQTFVCNSATGNCDAVSINEGLVCTDDGNPCTDNVCRVGVCAAENDDTNTCSDNSLCTDDACVAGGCLSTPVTCDDNNVCNGLETCDPALGCQAGTPLPCLDANLCNGTETCDALLGCQAGIPLTCDDNDACTGTETCVPATGCAPGTPLICTDNNVCNGLETCNPSSGCVAGSPLPCNDNNVCNGVEVCDAVSGCQAGPALNCDDNDACNGLETCDAINGCVAGTPVVCDTSDICIGFETCDPVDGSCIPGTPLDCNDNDLCTVDACDPGSGCLPKTPVDCNDNNVCTGIETCDPQLGCQTGDPLICDDMNLCTDDACDPLNGCQFLPDDSNSCEADGDLCTIDVCQAGVCNTSNKSCPADTECSSFSCEPSSGDCNEFPINEGLGCTDDGNECTADVCRSGACANEPTDGAVCNDDGLECTDDLCDSTGVCTHTNVLDGTVCTQDVLVCTLDVCKEGICDHLGMDEVCDDAVGCTSDLCDLIDDCVNTPSDITCDDSISCTIDACDSINDCQHTPDDTACNDGVACTSDVCDGVVGCVSSPNDSLCDDGVACTIDLCDTVNDCQHTPDSSQCDDGNECTLDQCTATGCKFTDTGLCGACCINSTKSCVSDVLQGTCSSLDGLFIGSGTSCLGDMDNDGIDDLCDNCNGANDAIFGKLVCSGTGISCEVDEDCARNEICQKACIGRIPTVSEWGLLVLTLLLLVCGKLYFGARRCPAPVRTGR